MSNRDLSLALRLYADATRFVNGLTQAEGRTHRFAGAVKGEFAAIRAAANSLEGQLAKVGLSLGLIANQVQSARMDKGLTQIGQTAGSSAREVESLRSELFRMSKDTGQQVDDLQLGFNNAVQAGLKFSEALPVIDATNKAMAVTGASADRLTAGLTVAGAAFDFDLAKPALAVTLLDKMTVAGRLGNAELQNLSDIFARVGVNAASAGFGFDKTLAFIETLSQVERQPERLATLADSTLRLFTNLKYAKAAAEATGVRFFDPKTGDRRDPIAVLRDLKKSYDGLRTEKQRAAWVQQAFGEADLDTQKGLRTLLGGDALANVEKFTAEIRDASGTIERDLPAAIANAVDQGGRLKNTLREAADEFARPINDAIQSLIGFTLDKDGLGLSGKDLIIGGGALAAGTFAAARYGGKAVGALANRLGGTVAGVAEGKALQIATGVTPVFVVNWPGGSVADAALGAVGVAGAAGGAAQVAGRARTLAVLAGGLPLSAWGGTLGGVATAGAGVTAAAAGGYAIGSAINAIMSWGLSKATGSDTSLGGVIYDLAHRETKIDGEIKVSVNQDGRVTSVVTSSRNRDVAISPVDVGYSMVSP